MVAYIQRWVWTSDADAQGTGQGTVYTHTNVPEDAYYLPDAPGPVIDQASGIVDWKWSHAAQNWVKVPRADDDPRGPDSGETPEPPPIEMTPVTRRQLRLTLVRNGISLATIEALITELPEGLEKEEAQIEWADAQTFERDHPTLLLIAHALSLTPAAVDQMWLEAMVA